MAKSFNFPDMISKSSGQFIDNKNQKELILQNLKLMLQSRKTELFGDPYWGTNLTRLLFDPNDKIIQDLVIDEIYNSIRVFVKEITVNRDDIVIEKQKQSLIANVSIRYNIDGTNDLYQIVLISGEE